MATLVWSENFESGSAGTWFPGGSSGTITADTTSPKVGAQSCKIVGDPAWGLKSQPASFIHVISFWIRLNAIPNGIELFSPMTAGMRFGIDDTTKKFGIIFGTAQTMTYLSTVTPVVGQWYRIEMRINASANPWVVDWQIDGVPQTQRTNAVAANNAADIYVGHATGFVASVNLNYDQIQYSQTAADYPLSAVSITLVAPPATFTASSVAPAVQRDYTIVAPPAVATLSSVAQIISIGNTETSPPAVTTFSAVAPSLSIGNTQVAPPAVTSFASVAPVISISPAPTAPPATFTASAVAPGIGRTLTPAAAVFTGSSVAPVIRVDLTIVALPATWTASAVAPAPRVDDTVVSPPATFTGSSVAPVILTGVSNTIVVPPAITTFSSATSATGITLATTPAVLTASSVAPVISKVVSVSPSPILATYSAVAPAVSGTALVVAPPASATYASVAPSLSLGASVTAPPATATFAPVAPQVQVGLFVTSPPATWTASSVAPGLGQLLVTTVGIWTASSVAPIITKSANIVAPPGVWTASAVGPSLATSAGLILSVSAAVATYAPVAPGISITLTAPPAFLTANSFGTAALLLSGNEITDLVRAAGVQGDGRPAESSFGIWEQAANLIPNGGFESGMGSGWGSYGGSINLISLGTDGGMFGANYLKCACTTVGNFGMKNTDFKTGAPLAQGPYTWSCWIRGNAQTVGKKITIQVNEQGGALGDQAVGPVTPTLTAQWQRVTGTGTFQQSDRTHMSLFLYSTGAAGLAGSAIGDEVHIDGVQVEQLGWATPYIGTNNAPVSRPQAQVRAAQPPIDPTLGWLAIRMRMGWPSTQTVKFPTSFIAYNSGATLNQIRLTWNTGSGGQWQALRWGGSVGVALNVSHAFVPGDYVLLVMAWNATTNYLSVNGAPFAALLNAAIPSGINSFCIGWDAVNNGRQIQSDVFWFACGSGVLLASDLTYLNGFGNSDPAWGQIPGSPTMLWTADTANAFVASVTPVVASTPTPVQATFSAAAPTLRIDATIVTPAAKMTGVTTSPTIFKGTAATVVAPPATATYSGLVPAPGVAPNAPAGRFTAAATAPVASVNILPNPITWTASGVGPIIGLGTVVNSPAAKITLSSTATVLFSTDVGAPAATWLASSLSPELVMRLVAPAAAVGYSSVGPECGTFAYIYAVPVQATFDGPVTSVIIEGSGMVYTYTPGAVWQAPDGDVAAPKTGRIVQSYERF